MNLIQWNIVVNGKTDTGPWGSPWLCTTERAIQLAEQLNPGTEIWPAVPVELSLVEQVKAYAKAHYDTGGWDVIVECWSDKSIAEAIDETSAVEEVLYSSVLAQCIGVWTDQQADAAVEGCTGDQYCLYHNHPES